MENYMIGQESPFRRLPHELDRRQTLFLDGMRHAVEIADLAHRRLVASLTELATPRQDSPLTERFAMVFLDAWAVVDAIDRFRQLLRRMPGARPKPVPEGTKTFMERTEPIRALRNAGDHVAERIDHIIQAKSTALGVLSWVTMVDARQGMLCSILPGTMSSGEFPLPNPAGPPMAFPTDMIMLRAGAHEANLSEAMRHLERQVRALEAALAQVMREEGAEDRAAGTDILVTVLFEFNDELRNLPD